MKKKLFFLILNNFIRKRKLEAGFSLIEAIVATLILSIAFGLNLQFLATLQVSNIRQKIETAAVSASKELMDEVRYSLQDNFATDYSTGLTEKLYVRSKSEGADYDLHGDVYVCVNPPTIDDNKAVDCPTTGGNTTIRYVVVQIRYPLNNEKVYTVQSAFSQLQEKDD